MASSIVFWINNAIRSTNKMLSAHLYERRIIITKPNSRRGIEFCRKQIQIADDEEDDRNIKDKKYTMERVVKTYNELIDEYKSLERKLQEGYEE